MIGYTPAEKFKYWLFQDKIPLTKLLLLSNVITFLAIALFKQGIISQYMSFDGTFFAAMPWTIFTYPLVWASGDPISLLFSGYWLWMAGGSLERSWSTQRYTTFFFLMCAISALGLLAGSKVLILLNLLAPVGLTNLWLPLAGLTVAFAMLNPEQQIMFMFVIPLKLKYLAMLSAGMVLIQYGMTHPLLGVFALAGCAFSYMFVMRPIRVSSPASKHRGEVVRVFGKRSFWQRINPFAWIKEWKEKRKLKKFFDRSDFRD